MNHYKLIQIISTKPELWDRCNTLFREPKMKEKIWEDVAAEMGETVASCKEGFKHLREKYVRERVKYRIFKDNYKQWEMLPYLKFLDNQIILRKSHHSMQFSDNNNSVQQQNSDLVKTKKNKHSRFLRNSSFRIAVNPEDQSVTNSINEVYFPETRKYLSQSDFDKELIQLVRNSESLWDWKNGNFSDKQTRNVIWHSISEKLLKSPSECMSRWKGLREKYIREKPKNKENNYKWEHIDSMSFLDDVIQYRKYPKNTDNQKIDASSTSMSTDFLFSNESATSYGDYSSHGLNEEENNSQEYSDNFLVGVKREYNDSSYDSYDSEGSSSKRKLSDSSCSCKKRRENEAPEKLFGELVASLLKRKTESDKHAAMAEIIRILAK